MEYSNMLIITFKMIIISSLMSSCYISKDLKNITDWFHFKKESYGSIVDYLCHTAHNLLKVEKVTVKITVHMMTF